MKKLVVLASLLTLPLAAPATAQVAYTPYMPPAYATIPGMIFSSPPSDAEVRADQLRRTQLVMARVEQLCHSTAPADQKLCARAQAVIQRASARYDAEHPAPATHN